MKEDMSGAAAVLAAMDALAQLNPSVNVIAVLPLSENLPSGKATKPGDVLKFYNGKTAEVLNTDAEGRLILGDALAYIEKHYDLDALVDVATLTGSCAYALGPFFTGLLSQDADLTKKVQKAADRTGDRVWPLPFDDDYAKAVESKVADICNIGNPKYKAGAVMAAFFLRHFVEKTPWVHLDIAGTAFDVPDIPYYRTGATGSAVRLLIDLARNW
jgi:leucyl aminopeptidase